MKAADKFSDELMVAFGAVDCTKQQDLCANYDVKGYPTLKYFSYFDKIVEDYSGGRKVCDFCFFFPYLSIEGIRGAGAQSVTVNRLVVGSIPTRGDEIFT